MDLALTSPSFEDDGSIPPKYTCDGANINPPLEISGTPDDAQSLVLLMTDPDVPESVEVDIWDHWIVWNIPPSTTEITEGEEPKGVHGTGTDNSKDYHGPCPPDGEHRYFFRLYALDTTLDLEEGATKEEVQNAIEGHVITQAELVGRYKRN